MQLSEHKFRARLKKELKHQQCHVFIAETITKGFPDLLVIDDDTLHITYYFELKVSKSESANIHLSLVEKMQLYYLKRLPHSYLLIHIPVNTVVVYTVTEDYKLKHIADVNTVRELLDLLRTL